MSWWTLSAIGGTGTAKSTIPPSLSRGCTRRSRTHPPLWEIYAEDAGIEDAQAQAQRIRAELEAAQERAGSISKAPTMRELPKYWDDVQRRTTQGRV